MLRSSHFALGLASLCTAGMICSGCSKQNESNASLSSGTGAITSGQVVGAAVAGKLPGIPGLSQLADLGNMQGPEIEITSPARAATLPAGNVQLTAKVIPGALGRSPAEVHVNGLSTPFAQDGTVTTNVTLTPGVNTIVVEAWDAANRRSERHVTVLAGEFEAETTPLPSASAFRLTDDGLDILEPQINAAIGAQRGALTQAVMRSNMGKGTTVKGFRYGQAVAQIDATPGGIYFQVDVPNVELDFEVKVKILFVFNKTKRGTIRAQNLQVTGMIQVGLDANGQITSSLTNVRSGVSGFSVPDFASKYRNDIQNAFTQGFATEGSKQINTSIQAVLAKAPSSGTVSQTILGQTITSDYEMSQLSFDDWGMTAVFGGNIRADNPIPGTSDRSFVTRTAVSDLIGAGPGWNGAVALHQDAINRTLHAAWRAGALSFQLDAQTFQRLGTVAPNTSGLISMSPGLASLLPANAPIDMSVETQLPPVVRVRPNQPHLMDLALPCVKSSSSYRDPQTGAVTSMGETYYTIEAQVSLQIFNGQMRIVPAGPVKVYVDLVGQALPGTEALFTKVADGMAGPVMQAGMANLTGLPVPTLNGITLPQVQFLADKESIVAFGAIVRQNP